MKKTGFGIIGTGAIAKVHADCLDEIADARLIAVASSSAQRAKKAESVFDATVYDDYHSMLERKDIDAVIITTQSGGHLTPTLAAAKAGKHVLCEKPLEITDERASQMIKACRLSDVKLGCIFQNRFNPQFQLLKKAVDEGYLGRILMGNASINWYRDPAYYFTSPWKGTIAGDGGAALINQGIHAIDLLLNLMGEVKSVFGRINTMVHAIEGEDVANATLEFRNGALGVITGGTALFPGHPERLEVFGERGSVIWEGGSIKEWNVEGLPRPETPNTGSSLGFSDPMAINNEMHKLQILDFIQAVNSDQNPLVSGEEGIKALTLISSIYQSSKEGKLIEVA